MSFASTQISKMAHFWLIINKTSSEDEVEEPAKADHDEDSAANTDAEEVAVTVSEETTQLRLCLSLILKGDFCLRLVWEGKGGDPTNYVDT